jgi:hypothetical protein
MTIARRTFLQTAAALVGPLLLAARRGSAEPINNAARPAGKPITTLAEMHAVMWAISAQLPRDAPARGWS